MSTDSERQHLHLLAASTRPDVDAKNQPNSVQLPYTAPDHRPSPPTEALDWVRAGLFNLAALLLVVTVLAFSRSTGDRASDQLLSVSPVLEFIWPCISFFLLGASLFALFPHQLSARRQRAVSIYPSIMAATLGCALTLAASFMPWAAFSMCAIGCLAGLLGIRELNRHTARTPVERLLSDAPVSLCTGFTLIFTVQLLFAAAQWNDPKHAFKALSALLIVSIIAAVAAHSERGRHALALGFVIGALTVAVTLWNNVAGPWWLSVVSVLCGLIVVLAAENRRHQITHAEHRAAQGLPVQG